MPVSVMQVRPMRVDVRLRLVLVGMRVLSLGVHLVRVRVVPVVVPVGMLVLDGVVPVRVVVRLREVQRHTDGAESAGPERRETPASLAHEPRHCGADERRRREDGARRAVPTTRWARR